MTRLTAQIIKNSITPRLSGELYGGEAEAIAKAWLGGDVLPTARALTPKDTGALAASLTVYVGPQASGIRTSSRKAPYVHGRFAIPSPPRRRTRPHYPPPNQSLSRWARGHGIAVFVLQQAIARRGTPIVPFIAEAVDKEYGKLRHHIDAAAKRIERRFNS